MCLIIGIDCPFYLLVLEFPQIPAEELLAGVGERLWTGVFALADSYAGELAKAHRFPLEVESLRKNPCKGVFSSPETSNLGATLVTGRRRDEGCYMSWATLHRTCAEVYAGHIIQLTFHLDPGLFLYVVI